VLKDFESADCDLREHPEGYRSVHYVLKSQPANQQHLVELQVRTIFEEGWSEIDHRIRYPNQTDNPYLRQFLIMFNGLAGSADQMGSFIKALSTHLKDEAKLIDSLNKKVEAAIARSEISKNEKKELQKLIDELQHASRAQLRDDLNFTQLVIGGRPTNLGWLTDVSNPSNIFKNMMDETNKIAGSFVCDRCNQRFPNSIKNPNSNFCPTCAVLKTLVL
jgi:hypothetical protein